MSDGTLSRTGPLCFVVTQESACRIGLENNFHQQQPLNTDHSSLVKFSSQSDDGYRRIADRMKDLVKDAPDVIKGRFSLNKGM
jgi:hypothetical protein